MAADRPDGRAALQPRDVPLCPVGGRRPGALRARHPQRGWRLVAPGAPDLTRCRPCSRRPSPDARPIFEVEEGGFRTVLQDGGRRHVAALGVPGAGPADPYSFRLANRLVGNAAEAVCARGDGAWPNPPLPRRNLRGGRRCVPRPPPAGPADRGGTGGAGRCRPATGRRLDTGRSPFLRGGGRRLGRPRAARKLRHRSALCARPGTDRVGAATVGRRPDAAVGRSPGRPGRMDRRRAGRLTRGARPARRDVRARGVGVAGSHAVHRGGREQPGGAPAAPGPAGADSGPGTGRAPASSTRRAWCSVRCSSPPTATP